MVGFAVFQQLFHILGCVVREGGGVCASVGQRCELGRPLYDVGGQLPDFLIVDVSLNSLGVELFDHEPDPSRSAGWGWIAVVAGDPELSPPVTDRHGPVLESASDPWLQGFCQA